MNEARIFGQGIGFPPRVDANGQWQWSSGPPNVEESIRVILSTARGERLRVPDFGCDLAAFLMQPDSEALRARIREDVRRSIERWEPRAEIVSIGVESGSADYGLYIRLHYRLRATGRLETLHLPVTGRGAVGRQF